MATLAAETQEWLEKARALALLAAQYRDQAESERRLPRPLFEDPSCATRGSSACWTPRSLSGGEVSLETAVRVTEEMAWLRPGAERGHCGNTSILWALVDPAAAREIFASGPRW